ncbi:MAG TPA: biopolymer transporter ExbD [Opitutae bacterium]|nr:biopolymer transporter ExbD [Opitutae bacterium]|tara:strand:+ start:1102 stop:1506 length:405 start_codon:yes stop_codon:yes gene_type:complete
MSLRRRSLDEEASESINVSPLIDVVFILLIFFIVSATFVTVPGVEVKRPEARTAQSLQKNSVLFAISERDEIFHAGARVSLEEIPRLIETASKNRPKPVVIQVDQWADASLMSKVVAKARRNAPSVSIATRKSR